MRSYLILAAFLAASLVAGCDADGDGIPDPPETTDDDDAADGSVDVEIQLDLGSCASEAFGLTDLQFPQVSVSEPEARNEQWEASVRPPVVTIPTDGQWWAVRFYAVPFTMAHTYLRVSAGKVWQAPTPDEEGEIVASATVPLHYNASALCVDAADYVGRACDDNVGREKWSVREDGASARVAYSQMGIYTPQKQVTMEFVPEAISGCDIVAEGYGSIGEIDPSGHSFDGNIGEFTFDGYRLE